MKPEELRIGNLLNYYGQEVIVLSVSRDRADFGYYPDSVGFERLFKPTDGPSDIPKPIPLSPEWLKRLGFTRNDVGEKFLDAIVWDHNQSSFRLVKYHGSNLPLYLEIGNKARRYVTEVHDLQNLYFAIESKELELKQ